MLVCNCEIVCLGLVWSRGLSSVVLSRVLCFPFSVDIVLALVLCSYLIDLSFLSRELCCVVFGVVGLPWLVLYFFAWLVLSWLILNTRHYQKET